SGGLPRPCRVRLLWPSGPRNDSRESLALCSAGKVRSNLLQKFRLRHHVQTGQRHRLRRGQHRLKSLIGQRGLTEPHRMSDDALSNRQVWMDRWDDLADVAHVGRTHARSLWREINRPSQFLQMSPKGVVTQLLAQQPNVDEHLNQPVEGVDSFVGGRRGVGGLAEKLYLEPVGCQG